MEGLFALIALVATLALYFLPSILAYRSRRKRRNGVLVINLFLGWTLIGWVVALAWAVSGDVEEKAK